MSANHHRPETFLTASASMSPQSPQAVDPRLQTETQDETASRSPATKKRASAGTAGTGDQPKATKRRAPRACTTCRTRKVRCDVTEKMPCTNCSYDNTQCHVQESRRRKKPVAPTGGPCYPLRTVNHPLIPNAMAGPPYYSAPVQQALPPQSTFSLLRGTGVPGVPLPLPLPFRIPGFAAEAPRPFNLPEFINPPDPTRFQAEDLEYMRRKGCFDLPPDPLRRKLIRAYIEHVHVWLPVIDIHSFLEVMTGHSQGGSKISLLLFQAVMFAAAAYVRDQDVIEAGYINRRQARHALFQRAKYLEALEYERDKHVLVQSLLLMSYWYKTPTETRDTWFYTGVAIALARTLNLHRDPDSRGVSAERAKLERRMWWCCVTRDRLIALGMRRPTRVRDEDQNTAKPTETDFEYRAVAGYDQIGEDCDVTRDEELQRRLAFYFIELVNLSDIIYQMHRSLYSTVDQTGNHMVGPRDRLDPANQAEVLQVDASLTQWFSGLKEWQRFQPVTQTDHTQHTEEVMKTHQILLSLLCQSTRAGLWRPFFALEFRSITPGDPRTQEVQRKAKELVPQIAADVTNMVRELQTCDLVRFLPTFAVTAILPALFIHMLFVRNPDPAVRERAVEGFETIRGALTEVSEVYAAAGYGLKFAEQVCMSSGVMIPTLQPAVAVHPLATTNHNSSMTPPPESSGINLGSMAVSQTPMYYQAPVGESTPPSSVEDTPMLGQGDSAMGNAYFWLNNVAGGCEDDMIMEQYIEYDGGEMVSENVELESMSRLEIAHYTDQGFNMQ